MKLTRDAMALASAALVACVAIALLIGSTGSPSGRYAFQEPPAHAPFVKLSVTNDRGIPREIFATVSPGVSICDVVICDIFEGFDGKMSPEAAKVSVGPPSGRWTDPWYRVEASYYERPLGRVSLCEVADSGGYHWETVAYPKDPACVSVFRNTKARDQILPIASRGGKVQVNILRSVGWGGISVFMSNAGCDKLILTAREAELRR